jgi:hypothetical protein
LLKRSEFGSDAGMELELSRATCTIRGPQLTVMVSTLGPA